MRGARMLNSVSRSLSDVGRSPSHVGAFSRRPLSDPAITRIAYARLKPSRSDSRDLPDLPDPHDLPDLYELEPLRPVREQPADRRRRRPRLLEPPRRLALRDFEQLVVAHEIDHAERRHARLARPEEIARTAQPQIALRDFEAVRRVGHRLEPLARFV